MLAAAHYKTWEGDAQCAPLTTCPLQTRVRVIAYSWLIASDSLGVAERRRAPRGSALRWAEAQQDVFTTLHRCVLSCSMAVLAFTS